MRAPAHTVLSIQQFLTKNSMTSLPHPPYLPYPTRATVFFFPWMKKVLKGKRFADVEEVKQNMTEALKGITIDQFKNCLEQQEKRLNRCVASDGEYFEGD